uniref:Uncharacterized protein n=1 Tax=Panagrolaimus davidi TaxID=227884 RepID=A0A914QGV8_9BILA
MGAIFLFNDTISEEYKNRLKEIINELFEVPTDSDKYIPLAIGYPGNELAKVEHVFDNLIKWYDNFC